MDDPHMNESRIAFLVLLAATGVGLSSCGGGGSGGGSTFAPPTAPRTDGWQQGVFEPASTFKSSCALPRNGINPATGTAYSDQIGSISDEQMYLRSFSNNTYLWYSEVTDRDPTLFDTALTYFDTLITNRTDANGDPIDRFHFTYDSQDWYELSQTGVSAGYGATIVFGSLTPPRDARIAFVEAGSPAAAAGFDLGRGDRILFVDGVSIDSSSNQGIDVLNAALFPSGPGENHQFEIQDQSTGLVRIVNMQTASISIDPVQVFTLSDGRRAGYLLFNDHIATAELALIEAVETLNSGDGIDELVLDLRYNGGGFLAIASELSYMIAGTDATANETFELLQFNDKHTSINPVTGRALAPTPFYSNALGPPFNAPVGMALPTLDLNRVIVLTGETTCSASEAIINGLRGINLTVMLVGSRTCGKPYGFYPEENCGTTYFTVQFQGVNALGFGDYPNGFVPANTFDNVGVRVPGCAVADDFDTALGDPDEAQLRAALDLLEGRPCPSPTSVAVRGGNKVGANSDKSDAIALSPGRRPMQNRIVRP
jgi:C-terminal processing protease CtpA/Prc